jgi:hypothetical protein
MKDSGRRRAHGVRSSGVRLVEGEGEAHVDLHELALPPRQDKRRFGRSYPHVPSAVGRRGRTRTAHASSTAEGGPGTGPTQRSAGPLFVDFEALARRQNALFEGLTPVHEKAALVSFIGTGITDPNRYENASAAFNQLRLMAPTHEGALIQVFTHKLREEPRGSDFLYLHFAGDPCLSAS